MNLYLTAAGFYAGTQKDAGKGHTAVEVATDKQSLIERLNDALRSGATPTGNGCAVVAAEAPVRPVQADEDLLPPKAQSPMTQALLAPEEADGHPVAHTAFTQAQVDGMFTATPAPLRELLHRISKLSLGDLGYVAFEVGHRFAKAGVRA